MNGLESGKKQHNGLKKKIGWARFGPNQLNGARGARQGGSGPRKKTQLIIGPGLGCGSWPPGRAQVCKNLAQTRPVAIPIIDIFKMPQIITPIATFSKTSQKHLSFCFFLEHHYKIDYLQHFKGVTTMDFLLLFSDIFKTSQNLLIIFLLKY